MEEQNQELQKQIEELHAQKLLRQQISNRKKTVGGNRQSVSSASSTSSSGSSSNGKFFRKTFAPNECSKCIVLEDMLTDSRQKIDEVIIITIIMINLPTI